MMKLTKEQVVNLIENGMLNIYIESINGLTSKDEKMIQDYVMNDLLEPAAKEFLDSLDDITINIYLQPENFVK